MPHSRVAGRLARWAHARFPDVPQANQDEARQLLSVPFALTRTVRVPENLRRPRVGESDGRRVWTFDLAINPQSNDADMDSSHDNYSAAVVQLPVRIDGRVALARKGLLQP